MNGVVGVRVGVAVLARGGGWVRMRGGTAAVAGGRMVRDISGGGGLARTEEMVCGWPCLRKWRRSERSCSFW